MEMELSPDFLSQCFLYSLSLDPEPRRAAEAKLAEASNRPNYALAVLRLVAEPCVADHIRDAAAVNLKNHLRCRWAPSPESSFTPIAEYEKHQIKGFIVTFMLSSILPRIRSQLSESLSLIGKHDFPKLWPTLLPELVANLNTALLNHDYVSINGILGTANSIFKKFRYLYRTDDLILDLKYCLDNFSAPLLELFLKTAALLDSVVSSGGGSPATMKPILESQRLCCRIFYSLNFQKLPEFCEDNMHIWMVEFHKFLTTSYPSLESSSDGLSVVDDLRAAVCENVNLYMDANKKKFKGYVGGFASAIWTLLGNVSQSSSRDRLTVAAINFFTIASNCVLHTIFGNDGAIPQICQRIVIPNLRLRDDDEELFKMNYIEFIRWDMEGNDRDTRRRIACKLMEGIAINYKMQITKFLALQVQNLLSSYASNPVSNWKDKDCAIYLVVSLATKTAGGASVSTDLVDVQNFFTQVILPELQRQNVNGFPLLKAGALKFLTVFRCLIPKPLVVQLLPDLIRFLRAESNVVHSYAACCIEKMLLVMDEGERPRYTSEDVAPFVQDLMNNLFNALKFPESEGNQYIMKCIMRVLRVAEISPEILKPCFDGLVSIVNEVCKDPKDPIFNQHLFESVAILVRRACQRDISLAPAFEMSLFPSLQMILVNDVTELFQYASQLLAQLLRLRVQSFAPLLSPRDTWTIISNPPALVRLLQALLKKIPHELKQEGRLSQVLDRIPTLSLLLDGLRLN